MSQRVVKVLNFSIAFRNFFGMCPFTIRRDRKDGREWAEMSFSSAFLPVVGCIITLALYYVCLEDVIQREGVPILDEDIFGSDLTSPSSVSFIVLGMSGTITGLTYIFLVLVTFYKRHSCLRIFQGTMDIFEKLDRDYRVECDTFRLQMITNGILVSSVVYHCGFVVIFSSIISFNNGSPLLPVVFLVLAISTTSSTFDLTSSMQLLSEIFERIREIPRDKYDTEMFLTFFEALELLEDMGSCQGLRECLNIGNQFFSILAQLFVLVYHIQKYGTVNYLFFFGMVSVVPRVINLAAIACFGSMLTTSIRNTARRIESELRDDYGKAAAFSMHMVLYKDSMAVTAHNFFSINLAMFYGIIGSTCTYFMVLAQFKADEENMVAHQNETEIV